LISSTDYGPQPPPHLVVLSDSLSMTSLQVFLVFLQVISHYTD